MTAIIADILVLLGAAGATVAVIGIARSRSGYLQIHATTLSVMAGAMLILAAALTTADGAIIARALLAGAVLLVTTPVSGHAIARLQFHLDSNSEDSRAAGARPGHPEAGGGSHTSGASPG